MKCQHKNDIVSFFKTEEDIYEGLVTNLTEEESVAEELEKLYHMRWG